MVLYFILFYLFYFTIFYLFYFIVLYFVLFYLFCFIAFIYFIPFHFNDTLSDLYRRTPLHSRAYPQTRLVTSFLCPCSLRLTALIVTEEHCVTFSP